MKSATGSSQSVWHWYSFMDINVSFEGAAIRAAQLGVDLQVPLTAFFSWPSRATVVGYTADEASSLIADFPINFTAIWALAISGVVLRRAELNVFT
jgi:Alpha/beta hydrolase of unknown function (DUF900)